MFSCQLSSTVYTTVPVCTGTCMNIPIFTENGLNQIQKSYDELKNWLSVWKEEADINSFLVCTELQNGHSLSKGMYSSTSDLVFALFFHKVTEANIYLSL